MSLLKSQSSKEIEAKLSSGCWHEQLRRQVNLRSSQRLGNRTVLLGIKRNSLECRIVNARNVGFSLKLNAGDRKRLSNFVQFDVGYGMDAIRRNPRLGKLCGQRHGEAAGVGGADQLFWIRRRLSFFQSGLKGVWALEGPAADF